MKIRKYLTFILAGIFFGIMIFFTISARKIHNSMLPQVKVKRLTREKFVITEVLGDGSTRSYTTRKYAIPKEFYDNHKEIFSIGIGYIYDEERTVARLLELNLGTENEDYYEVKNEFFGQQPLIIVESSEELSDGDEVYIIEE